MENVDFAIIGGGLFGLYAALYLSKKGASIIVIEKDGQLMRRASIVNQARLHGGYHYPRSITTATMSDEHRVRFTQEHKDFVNFDFQHFYAIDKFESQTDAQQFERFCEYIGIEHKLVKEDIFIERRRVEAIFETHEYAFDPLQVADYYISEIQKCEGVEVLLNTSVQSVEKGLNNWNITVEDVDGQAIKKIDAGVVINATYSGSNGVNRLFGLSDIELMHEISEMVFVDIPKMNKKGITVMDGPFGSIMPYGNQGYHSMSSVVYTHHEQSHENIPRFACQERHPNCRPEKTANCLDCEFRPTTNYHKMRNQMNNYLKPEVEMKFLDSWFTIKSKLKASYIDDSRPTEIQKLNENPAFYCIFAGKINSIYEIEKII